MSVLPSQAVEVPFVILAPRLTEARGPDLPVISQQAGDDSTENVTPWPGR
jgi:hypothetical protein